MMLALQPGSMSAGAILGNHYHRRNRLLLFLASGAATVYQEHPKTKERIEVPLAQGRGIELPPGIAHAIHFQIASRFVLLKSLSHDADPTEVVPYEVWEPERDVAAR